MKSCIHLAPALQQALWRHLLPEGSRIEHAAFLLCRPSRPSDTALELHAVERFSMIDDDVHCSQYDYLELSDDCRARLIKRAHETRLCPVEFHSHLGSESPAFSLADKSGLEEFVPHVRWRLANRPYAAIVVSRGGFDGLVWADNSGAPQALTELIVGGERLEPSHRTLPYWRSCYARNALSP